MKEMETMGSLDPSEEMLYKRAVMFIAQQEAASTFALQSQFDIDFNLAGKLMDRMEADGYVGPSMGASGRNVLITTSEISIELPIKVKSSISKWKKSLDIIATKVSKPEYDWFKAVQFVSYEDGKLTLGVPSEWYAITLDEKYSKELSVAIRRCFGNDVKLFYQYK